MYCRERLKVIADAPSVKTFIWAAGAHSTRKQTITHVCISATQFSMYKRLAIVLFPLLLLCFEQLGYLCLPIRLFFIGFHWFDCIVIVCVGTHHIVIALALSWDTPHRHCTRVVVHLGRRHSSTPVQQAVIVPIRFYWWSRFCWLYLLCLLYVHWRAQRPTK